MDIEQKQSLYDQHFYDVVSKSAMDSCREVIPVLKKARPIHSVLDVGCGQGGWLRTWSDSGVKTVVGIDGPHVSTDHILIEKSEFLAHDLRQPLDLGKTFDLVQCLEVAEHIDKEYSGMVVDSLIRHGDFILFSAAYPGDGGVDHINEQPYEFWRDLFAERGYRLFDFVRPQLKGNLKVDYWFRFNLLLFVKNESCDQLPAEVLKTEILSSQPVPVVSPWPFKIRNLLIRQLSVKNVTRLARTKARVLSFLH